MRSRDLLKFVHPGLFSVLVERACLRLPIQLVEEQKKRRKDAKAGLKKRM